MSHLFWLHEAHLKRIQHLFPKPRGVARVDDRRVLSGIKPDLRFPWQDRCDGTFTTDRTRLFFCSAAKNAASRALRSEIRCRNDGTADKSRPSAVLA